MTEENDRLDEDDPERIERYLLSLIDDGELHFPKMVRHAEPGKEVLPPVEVSARRPAVLFDRIAGFFLRPAVAYALLLCLIYPAYLGIFRKSPVVKEKQVVQETPTSLGVIAVTRDVSLGGGVTREGGGEKEIILSKTDNFFMLSFFVPVTTEPNTRYDLEVRGEDGSLIAEQKAVVSRDILGNFSIVCNKQLFKEGSYVLELLKVDKATSAKKGNYRFKFKIVHAIK